MVGTRYRLSPDEKSNPEDAFYEDWLEITDADGNEVVRVGFRHWRHSVCSGFQGTDEEREELAHKIVAALNDAS